MYEQERFIVRLRQRLLAEPAIVAAWLSGSFGRDAADGFSALDVTLLYADDRARDDAWRNRADFCHSILAYVPARSVDDQDIAHCHITLFANGALVRFHFAGQTSLAPTVRDQQIKILKDSADKRAANHAAQSAHAAALRQTPTVSQLRLIDDHFWVGFWDVYRQLRRGVAERPFAAYLTLLAETLPPLLEWLPVEDAAHQRLIDVHYSRDARQTLADLRRLLEAYLAARQSVISRYQLDYRPDSSFETQIDRALSR